MASELKASLVADFSWAIKAARNNAEWCDFVCRSHRVPGEFYEDIWINRNATPPFYPNVVTLSPWESMRHHEIIRELIKMPIPGGWGVKDSFAALDLASEGFQELLTGEWICWPKSSDIPDAHIPGISWRKIEKPAELTAWENAWRGNSQERSSIFLPRLLQEQRIVFIAAFQENKILAGCIANRSEHAVGISNIFLSGETPREFHAGCVAEVFRRSGGLPLIGWERGDDLVAMRSLGFESVGRLKVWVKRDEQCG